jgi:hypothetical protein
MGARVFFEVSRSMARSKKKRTGARSRNEREKKQSARAKEKAQIRDYSASFWKPGSRAERKGLD